MFNMHVINVSCIVWSNYEVDNTETIVNVIGTQFRTVLVFDFYTSATLDL